MATLVASDFAVLTVLLKDIPSGAWVALSSDNRMVLAFGTDMRSVLIEAKRAGEVDPIMLRVPETSWSSGCT
jgi:hypothetical protein